MVNKATYKERVCSHGHARGARELANWLADPDRLATPEKLDAAAAEKKLAGSTGIVFIRNCFTRRDGSGTIGHHIDLWDKTEMKSQPASLLKQGDQVWFWRLK
jgi:hypothetical protein